MTELKNAKEQLLDSAESLIQTRGYNDFSFRDLAESVGISSASVHHHYRTKEALGVAVTSRYTCLLYTSPSPRDQRGSRMPSSA